jgi:heterotetrameric sarcosine oxidase gamma subunit
VLFIPIFTTLAENVIVTDVTSTILAPAPLHAFEIWSNPGAVAQRFKAATGFALPATGRADGTDALRLMRYEPTVWLVEGDTSPLAAILADEGALTAIGGGVARVRLSGSGWRTLLMEGGVFDAENPAFSPGCCVSTIIEHVNVRLHVVNEGTCDAYVPLSYSKALIHFWHETSATLAL